MRMFSTPSSCKVGPVSDSDPIDHHTPLPPWKRTLDIICCLVAVPPFLICTFFAAILTWTTSPGPIFFRQERIGLRGRRFDLFKFRTMHVSADTTTHQLHFAELVRSNRPMHKLDRNGDCRLIPGGWLLRASGLDELPQIMNVLWGDMSLVGPRPCIPYEYAQYSPAQRERFATAPGLTGLWQVSGKNRTTFDEMIQLDIRYVHNRSLGLDLLIMLKTPWAVWVQISDIRRAKKALNGTMQDIPAPSLSEQKKTITRAAGTPSAQPWCTDLR
jgi:lipopolysaccharide/colanic/teichoic acid biosynthesis glycosyltransferase